MEESISNNNALKERQSDSARDNELVRRIRENGDMVAFEELMTLYQDKVWRLARGITRSDSDAEDVIQDVFITVFKKLDMFEGRSSFSSWLYRIAANASYMKIRARKNVQPFAPEDIAPLIDKNDGEVSFDWAVGPEDALVSKETVEVISDAIDSLPEEYRVVILLRDMEGFSNNEVSDMLGLSVPAIKSRLHRGRLFLRKRLVSFYRTDNVGTEAR